MTTGTATNELRASSGPHAPTAEAENDLSFQEVVDGLAQAVVVLSATGESEYLSRAGREFLGVDLATSRTQWRDSMHPDDAAGMLAARSAGILSGEPWTTTVRMRRHDGVYRWFDARVTPLRRPDGSVKRWVGSFTDVHDTLALMASLRSEQERFDTLDAVMPGVLVSFRRAPDGTVSFPLVSPRYFELTGVSAAMLAADPLAGYRVVHPDDYAEVMAGVEQARRTMTAWHGVYRLIHPERGIVWIDAHSVPRKDADGGTTWHGVLHDVTEQQRATEQTRLWADAFRHCSHGIGVGDPKTGTLITCNAAYSSLLGLAEKELRGRAIASLYDGAQRDVVARAVADAARVGHSHFESRMRHEDGTPIDVQVDIVGVKDASGAPLYNIATVQDVRARKEAALHIEEISSSLRTSEERFRLLFDESPASKCLIRLPEAVVADVNAAWLTSHGYRREDVIGRPVSSFVLTPPELIEARRREMMWKGAIGPVESPVRRGDGTLGITEIYARAVDIEGVTHILAVHQDVTARREAERALVESNARFKQLAENIHEVFWLTNVEKNEIVYVSPGYETIWGRSCAALYANPMAWLEAIHDDDRARILAAMPKQAAGSYDEEYRIVRPDGTIRWVQDRGFPVRDEGGKLVGIAGVAQDVTNRRELELQLRQAQKLESIGSLAGGIAHDFNNWLTVIGGSASLLLDRPDLDAATLEVLGDINLASARAAGLTHQLLAFSRKEIVEPRIASINDVVVDTERMLSRLLGEDIALSTQLAPNLWPVRLDKGQWSQILINLAVNARDAMPRGGTLAVQTRNTTAADGSPFVVVQMTDSGTGMTDEVRARLFEPFFTTKGLGRGTGLGLAVVHGIVTQSGGRIEVESTLGVGTTFRLHVPAVPATNEKPKTADDQPRTARAGTETILLVEDEEALRRFVRRALARDGYTVLDAGDGIEALELAQKHEGTIDLVITDVVMPRLGGPELAACLYELRPELRVLYTTGYTDDATLRHGVRQAEVALVAKPFTYAVLRERIRELLDTGTAVAATEASASRG